MSLDLSKTLVIGISSRALFNLEKENEIFETQNLQAYADYQIAHEEDVLKPGAAFPLIKALHNLNTNPDQERLTEIILMSRNSADTSLRIFKSIEHYGLDISRAALVGGASIAPYLDAFQTDLFLSANETDVQNAINANIAAGLIYTDHAMPINELGAYERINIAFDGDAVLFSGESEHINQTEGLEAFVQHEKQNAKNPLPEGPFLKLLKTISYIQSKFDPKEAPIRTALVTARNMPAHERAIRTLRYWGVRVDEAFFLGGLEKSAVLKAFAAHIFFDDQENHVHLASKVVPAARVLNKNAQK